MVSNPGNARCNAPMSALLWASSLLATLGGSVAAQAAAPLNLGVNTHFGTTWGAPARGVLARNPATVLRDTAIWRRLEPQRGVYDFSAATTGHIDRTCADGRKLIITLPFANPVYEGGLTINTPASRTAYGKFVAALGARYPNCIIAFEIGNEINAVGSFTGPAAADPARSYVAILREIYPQLKAAAPNIALLGGSSNVVGTGFLAGLADVGMLEVVDGIAVHPYRQDPGNLDWELQRLGAALDARGPHRPIWATEFSRDFAKLDEAPDFLAKMVTLLSVSGVEYASWYQMIDYSATNSFGLFDPTLRQRPAGLAFDYWVTDVLPHGAAVRVDTGDPTLFHYRFGADRQVVWSSGPRAITVTGASAVHNSRGAIVPMPAQIGVSPLVFDGNAAIDSGAGAVVADTLDSFGRAPWTYWGQRPGKPALPLAVTDWQWASFIGNPNLKPAAFTPIGVTVADGATAPIAMTARFTASAPAPLVAVACLAWKANGTALRFELRRNGTSIKAQAIAKAPVRIVQPLTAGVGDTIDFVVRPGNTAAVATYNYRYRLIIAGTSVPTC
jgi:hypothetical protein